MGLTLKIIPNNKVICYEKQNYNLLFISLSFCTSIYSQPSDSVVHYISVIKSHVYKDFKGMYRKAGGTLVYPSITPGSIQYDNVLWDWGSWLSNVALGQILNDVGIEKDKK